MSPKAPQVSVIFVTHKEDPELLVSLKTVTQDQKGKKNPAEVIVVDNNAQARLKPVLKKKFPTVRYVNSGANIGFGPANNVGAKAARGKYFFFLNPDTEMVSGAIEALADFLDENPRVGVVAPTLFDREGQRYPDQGTGQLNPLTGLASHSILHTLWPNNPIATQYFGRGRDLTQPQQVAVVPGTALMVRRSVYEKVGGFDERFFIYFEENDLCRRIAQAGWQMWIIPTAQIRHIWHAATTAAKYNRIFRESRFKYFEKYYGVVVALLVEAGMRLNKWGMLFMFLLSLAGVALLLF